MRVIELIFILNIFFCFFIKLSTEIDQLIASLIEIEKSAYQMQFCQRYGEAIANQRSALKYAQKKWFFLEQDLTQMEAAYSEWLGLWDKQQLELDCESWLHCFHQHHEVNTSLDEDYPNERLFYKGSTGRDGLFGDYPINGSDCGTRD